MLLPWTCVDVGIFCCCGVACVQIYVYISVRNKWNICWYQCTWMVGPEKIVYRIAIWRNMVLVYCCDGYIQDNCCGFISGVYFCFIQ